MEHLDKATAAATWFESFIQHASVMSIVLSLLGSWFATAFFKIPIRWWSEPARHAFYIRAVDIAVAFALCLITWPNEWGFVWAFVIGFGSPVIYWLLASAVCWKFPKLKPFLSLRELASDDSPVTGDDTHVPPGDTQ